MDKAPGVLIATERVSRPRPTPRLRLLVAWESRHRVFFGNLADLLLQRRVQQYPTTSKPARFWPDVFVPSGIHWTSFIEALLLNSLLVVLFIWGQSRVWDSVKLFPQPAARRSITYYPPTPSFRAAESRASSPRARTKSASPRRQSPMPVAPEHKPSLITPPDIKQAAARPPSLPSANPVTPIVPFPAAAGSRRTSLSGPSGVVAPLPQVEAATTRRSTLPQASAVAPAPDFAGSSAGRTAKVPNAQGPVPPQPALQGADASRSGRLSSLASGQTKVFPPQPSLQNAGVPTGTRRGSLAAGSSQVVPPPPSVQGANNSGSTGRLSSLQGSNAKVVPPPPSVQGTGNAAGEARLGALAGRGSQVVPPAPTVQSSGRTARAGSLASAGSQVVPPPPSVTANSSTGGRLGSLPGNGSQIVPPPPSVEGSGGNGRLGSLSVDGSQVASPPVEQAGNLGGGATGKLLEPMDPLSTGDGSGSATAGANEHQAEFQELPLGLLGVIFAAPGTSFFSNFEVFVAKRRVGKDEVQLIKLVYEFLPYQRRLSEYDLNNVPARIIKLKVTPDPSCDESLGQMIQAHADPTNQTADPSKLPQALRSSDLNAMLPCYRTTATDFQKAMGRAR